MSFFIFIVGADTGSGHSCCIQMQTRDRRSDGQGHGTRKGLHSQHSFVLGIYFIQNKGENETVPADMFIIICLQDIAHCRMWPHGEAEGGEWRLLQPTVLSLFSPPPAQCAPPRLQPPAAWVDILQQSLQAGQRRF